MGRWRTGPGSAQPWDASSLAWLWQVFGLFHDLRHGDPCSRAVSSDQEADGLPCRSLLCLEGCRLRKAWGLRRATGHEAYLFFVFVFGFSHTPAPRSCDPIAWLRPRSSYKGQTAMLRQRAIPIAWMTCVAAGRARFVCSSWGHNMCCDEGYTLAGDEQPRPEGTRRWGYKRRRLSRRQSTARTAAS